MLQIAPQFYIINLRRKMIIMKKQKESKTGTIHFRIHENLKARLQQALELEGVSQTQFFVARILEFCEQSEKKHAGLGQK